ncbi:MAG: hypothetical protein AB7O21_21245 [Gammaproteobacteria bacterium]
MHWMRDFRWRTLFVAVAVAVALARAEAIPVYRASVGVTGAPIVSDEGDFGAHAADAVLFSATDGKLGNADARADFIGLGINAFAHIPVQPPVTPFPPITMSAGGSARLRVEDLVITNVSDPGNLAPIPVALSFTLSGLFDLLQNSEDDSRASASIGIDYGLGVPGVGSTATPVDIGGISRISDRGILTATNRGMFNGLLGEEMQIDGMFQTPSIVVPVGVPLHMTFQLSAGASVATRDGSEVNASTMFGHTVSFGPGAVFVLPAGYTSNSVQAGIVDNVAVVPLPSAVWLMLSGLGVAAMRVRSKSADVEA